MTIRSLPDELISSRPPLRQCATSSLTGRPVNARCVTGADDQLLAVHDALDKLAIHHKAKADVVKLRYFVGMTILETAEVLGISEPTANNYWAWARVWLYQEIKARAVDLD